MSSENPTPETPDTSEVQAFAGKKIAAGICGILLGQFGVHKFILGINTPGIIMLVVSMSCLILGSFLCLPLMGNFVMFVIGLVEGIIYLTKSDQEFYDLYAVKKKEWF